MSTCTQGINQSRLTEQDYLQTLENIRQRAEQAAYDKAGQIALPLDESPQMLAVKLSIAAADYFETESKKAFPIEPPNLRYYKDCCEPNQLTLIRLIEGIVTERLSSASTSATVTPENSIA